MLRPLSNTLNANQSVLGMTDRYFKLTRRTSNSKTSSSHIGSHFMGKWTIPYSIRITICNSAVNCLKRYAPSWYDSFDGYSVPSASYGEAERFIETIIAKQRHYVAERQRNWDIFVQQLTYAYNAQVPCSTNSTPFCMVLLWHPPGLTTFNAQARY